MIKAIIFDYFGVVSSDEYWGLVKTDKDLSSDYLNLANRVNLGKLHWQEFINELAGKVDKPIDDIKRVYEAEKINPQVLALASELHKTYKTALLSNASHEFLDPIVEQAHLGEVFDVIVISSRVGFIKPDPRIFEYTLSELAVEASEAIFIDDIERNVQAAEALGIKAILYTNIESLKDKLLKIDA